MCLYLENLPAPYMPKAQGSTWQHKVYLIAGESPSQMEMMKVQLFQGTARWVLLNITKEITLFSNIWASERVSEESYMGESYTEQR